MTESRQTERERMVERQIAARDITDEAILSAFREVPRETFVDREMEAYAYEDSPLPIPSGQTISQPYIVACMIAAARVKAEDTVLEVGAGSGYAAAVLSRIASEVHAVERHEALARQAAERMEKLGYNNCQVIAGDGMEGLPDQAPYDAILVAARTDEVPVALKSQLKIGGRLIIPVGEENIQQLQAIVRDGEDSWKERDITPVRFVPLLNGVVADDLAQKT